MLSPLLYDNNYSDTSAIEKNTLIFVRRFAFLLGDDKIFFLSTCLPLAEFTRAYISDQYELTVQLVAEME